jgi:hypothetical protein
LIVLGSAGILLCAAAVAAILPAALRLQRHARAMQRDPLFAYATVLQVQQHRITVAIERMQMLADRAQTHVQTINGAFTALRLILAAVRLVARR